MLLCAPEVVDPSGTLRASTLPPIQRFDVNSDPLDSELGQSLTSARPPWKRCQCARRKKMRRAGCTRAARRPAAELDCLLSSRRGCGVRLIGSGSSSICGCSVRSEPVIVVRAAPSPVIFSPPSEKKCSEPGLNSQKSRIGFHVVSVHSIEDPGAINPPSGVDAWRFFSAMGVPFLFETAKQRRKRKTSPSSTRSSVRRHSTAGRFFARRSLLKCLMASVVALTTRFRA